MMETSIKKNQAESNSNKKALELMNDKGLKAPYLASSLPNLFEPENTSWFKLRKDHSTIGVIDFLINAGLPVTL